MANVYGALNSMPSTVPSILHALVKKVLVVLHFRREGTEEQRELPDVTCTVREQSPRSPATSSVDPQHTQAWVRKTTPCLRDDALEPYVDSASWASAPAAESPGLKEGSPFPVASQSHAFMGTSLPALLSPVSGVCGIIWERTQG